MSNGGVCRTAPAAPGLLNIKGQHMKIPPTKYDVSPTKYDVRPTKCGVSLLFYKRNSTGTEHEQYLNGTHW